MARIYIDFDAHADDWTEVASDFLYALEELLDTLENTDDIDSSIAITHIDGLREELNELIEEHFNEQND